MRFALSDLSLPGRLQARPDPFGPPAPTLQAVVAVPAKNESARLSRLVAALAGQRDLRGLPLAPGSVEVLLFLNACTDDSLAVALRLCAEHPHLTVRVLEASPEDGVGHVGDARQRAMDLAFARLLAAGRPQGLILTTDADSRPAPDWIAQTAAEVARGADLVGGRVLLEPAERAALAPGVRALYLLDVGYRRLLEHLSDLYCPSPHDPFPRHHQHYGASLAITAAAYAEAGGLPAEPVSEDVALMRAVEALGGHVRHSDRVRVFTSARRDGRAEGGLASAFQFWDRSAMAGQSVLVEAAWHAECRMAAAAQALAAGHLRPDELLCPPDPPPPDIAVPIRTAVRDLRALTGVLSSLSHADRLQRARCLPAPFALQAPASS